MKDALGNIANIKRKIKLIEILNEDGLEDTVRELREDILYVHFLIESTAEYLLLGDILQLKDHNQNIPSIALALYKFRYLFSGMSFFTKISTCKKLKLISNDAFKNFKQINQLRNWFSHPTSYRAKLSEFRNTENLLGAYKTLDEAVVYLPLLTNYFINQ